MISDVGVNTTMALIDDLRDIVKNESLKEPDQVRVRMRGLIAEMLTDSSDFDAIPDNEPVVLLVVGVNGAGKTTSIAKLVDVAKSGGQNVPRRCYRTDQHMGRTSWRSCYLAAGRK